MKKLILILIIAAAALFFLYKNFTPSSLKSSSKPPVVEIEKNGSAYRLTVDGEPYLIKGFCYSPVPIGKDYEYNFWGDGTKPWLTDGKMMKEAGANTIRLYRPGKNPVEVKAALEDLRKKYGVRVLMGHYLGYWDWPPPNYTDENFTSKVRQQVLEMVRTYRDSPAILMWVLGNENNYSFDLKNMRPWSNDAIDALPDEDARRDEKAKIYYSFVNGLAAEIKKIDPARPVIMGVGEVASLHIAKQYTPDVDIVGMIAYRGPGFANLFRQIEQKIGKPVVMIEWGADSYNAQANEPDEANQAEFIKLQWRDIERNADGGKGVGNSLGGTLFEWNDEWWKSNENLPHTWTMHDTSGHWSNTSYYFDAEVLGRMNMNEEWWGAVSLDPKKKDGALNERVPKESYNILKNLWTGKEK